MDPIGDKKVALVVGAGDATGSAIARRFAREGYVACLARRSADTLQPDDEANPGAVRNDRHGPARNDNPRTCIKALFLCAKG